MTIPRMTTTTMTCRPVVTVRLILGIYVVREVLETKRRILLAHLLSRTCTMWNAIANVVCSLIYIQHHHVLKKCYWCQAVEWNIAPLLLRHDSKISHASTAHWIEMCLTRSIGKDLLGSNVEECYSSTSATAKRTIRESQNL
jgi:hypothetical protein